MDTALPDYVMPIRGIRAAVHPQTGEAGLEVMDQTSASVFLPLPLDTLQWLAAEIGSVLMQISQINRAI